LISPKSSYFKEQSSGVHDLKNLENCQDGMFVDKESVN
jgi:hypothetical protein